MYDDLIDEFMDALDDGPDDHDFVTAAKRLWSQVTGRDVERRTPKLPALATPGAPTSAPEYDHSKLVRKHYTPGLGACQCKYCKDLPW